MVLEGHIRGSSYHPFLPINTLGSVSSPENLMEGQYGTRVTLSVERRALRMMGKEGRRGENTGTGRIIALNSLCRLKSQEPRGNWRARILLCTTFKFYKLFFIIIFF